MFKFLDYSFDHATYSAVFRYQNDNQLIFAEKIFFDNSKCATYNKQTLNQALFFAFIVLGTSYYKLNPTKEVILTAPINQNQADFFDEIYQEGLSQFAYENHLTRNDLAHFHASANETITTIIPTLMPASTSLKSSSSISSSTNHKRLVLLSGGKDSLLTAEILTREKSAFTPLYIANTSGTYPEIINAYGKPLIIRRLIDKDHLKEARGFNGHVPVTLINESLSIIQAIISGYDEIILGLGKEGLEPHTYIDDLAVNHQWSKTPHTQKALQKYISDNIANNLTVTSLLSNLSELEIAEKFASLCWEKFGHTFSSCNRANYKQGEDNRSLRWCGECPKCANSFLLFAPFVPFQEQEKLFHKNLFKDPNLTNIFKGLLGIDGIMKPFECVAETSELRQAYHQKLPGYDDLPFKIK